MNNNYYVYRYIRLDTNTPFHVGKGKKNRYKEIKRSRNKYFKAIVSSIPYEVEIIVEGLTNDQANDKEKEFVKLYKSLGYCETNLTDGGEGFSGYKMSPESIEKMAASKRGKPSPRKGVILGEEQLLKMSLANLGKTPSKETREKISKKLKGKTAWNKNGKMPKSFSIKQTAFLTGKPSRNKGKKLSKEQRDNLSKIRKNKPNLLNRKKVEVIETREIFDSLTLASEHFGLKVSTLQKVIKLKSKNRKTGFTFRYL